MTLLDHSQVLPGSHWTLFKLLLGIRNGFRITTALVSVKTWPPSTIVLYWREPLTSDHSTGGVKPQLSQRILSTSHWETFPIESTVVPFLYLVYSISTTFQPWRSTRKYWISVFATSSHMENLQGSFPATQKLSASAVTPPWRAKVKVSSSAVPAHPVLLSQCYIQSWLFTNIKSMQ